MTFSKNLVKSLKLNESTKAKILYEMGQLEKLLGDSEPLLIILKNRKPDFVEKSAAALILHSFYNGIENILKIIVKDSGDEVADREKWHRSLLEFSFMETEKRKAVFRESLRDDLNEYLAFRHFIRHSYGFEIIWDKMEPLFLKINKVWSAIKEDLSTL